MEQYKKQKKILESGCRLIMKSAIFRIYMIYIKHLTKDTWLLPSLIIPFLKNAHSRGCEYTCDRIGYHFSGQGAIEGILILSSGKEIYSKINISRFIENAEKESSFWVWFSEKFLSHPHVSKRLLAVKKYDQRGY